MTPIASWCSKTASSAGLTRCNTGRVSTPLSACQWVPATVWPGGSTIATLCPVVMMGVWKSYWFPPGRSPCRHCAASWLRAAGGRARGDGTAGGDGGAPDGAAATAAAVSGPTAGGVGATWRCGLLSRTRSCSPEQLGATRKRQTPLGRASELIGAGWVRCRPGSRRPGSVVAISAAAQDPPASGSARSIAACRCIPRSRSRWLV